MFLKRFDNQRLENDFIVFYSPAVASCGQVKDKIVALRHLVVIDTATVTTVDRFSLDGVVYTLSAAIPTTTLSGRAQILAEIKVQMAALGYTEGSGVWTNPTGAFWALHLDPSAKDFGYLGAAGNAFVPVDGLILGSVNSSEVKYFYVVKKRTDGDYDLTVKILMSKPLSAFSVTYDGNVKTAVVPATGQYTFVIAAADAVLEKALAVSATTDGAAYARSITEKFANYTT